MRSADEELMVQRDERSSGGGERQIQVHPLVIMNAADHFTRQRCNFQQDQRAASSSSASTHPLADVQIPQVIGALFGIQNGLDVSVYDSFEMKYDVVNGEVQIDKEFLTSRIQQCPQFLILPYGLAGICVFLIGVLSLWCSLASVSRLRIARMVHRGHKSVANGLGHAQIGMVPVVLCGIAAANRFCVGMNDPLCIHCR